MPVRASGESLGAQRGRTGRHRSTRRATEFHLAPEAKRGLFARLLELFRLGNDPERVKKRLLKGIARDVTRDRASYFIPRTHSAGPGLARVFHTFAQALGPAQTLLEAARSSEALRSMVVESCLSPEELELRESLTEEGIEALAGGADGHRLGESVSRQLGRLKALITSTRSAEINTRVRDYLVFLDLIFFDYHAVLRKFDPSYPRGDPDYLPRFVPVDAGQIAGHLKDFLEILQCLDTEARWDVLFDTLKEFRRVDAVSRDSWRKLLRAVDRFRRTDILANVVRLIDRDPQAEVPPRDYPPRGAEEYGEKVRVAADLALQRVLSRKRTAKRDQMTIATFKNLPETRLVYYVEAAKPAFEKRGAPGYSHAAPLNFLLVYLDDYLAQEVKGVVDLVLVKGRWSSTQASHDLSKSCHELLRKRDQVAEFDGSLAPAGPWGQKIKAAMLKAGISKKDAYVLRQALRTVNEDAKALVGAGIQGLVALGQMLKGLIDDIGSGSPTLVMNLRDLDKASKHRIRNDLVAGYTRMYNLGRLLTQYRDVGTS